MTKLSYIYLEDVTTNEIFNELTNVNKSIGADGILAKCLKEAADIIAFPNS